MLVDLNAQNDIVLDLLRHLLPSFGRLLGFSSNVASAIVSPVTVVSSSVDVPSSSSNTGFLPMLFRCPIFFQRRCSVSHTHFVRPALLLISSGATHEF
ncbi:unnamed protein product [Citrullus colocynthis]|uniref:Uncharacterized protein n=1 Tax=Citrullus colocynthis TaxID=252529 RepID=A0ABP0Z6Q8_9ROSI